MSSTANRFIASVAGLCAVSVGLLVARVISSDSSRYIFLLWNLVLAAIPALLAYWLVQRIREFGWLKWQQLAITAGLLAFLPNSFYLVTDFVHLRDTFEVSLIYDVVLLASFMFTGLVLGYSAVYLVHRELRKRFAGVDALIIVGILFFTTSFAIYLGRFTRWNTWDLLLQPAGLLFDVSERFVNPSVHADTYVTTVTIFLLLFCLYMVIYQAIRLARHL